MPRDAGSNVGALATVVVADGGPPPKRRQLERTNSDPTVITQQVLQRMQSATARGDFTSTDATSPDTVEFWVRMVVRSMTEWNKGDGEVDLVRGHSYKLFARFVCNLLLDNDSYGALSQFTPFPKR